MGRDAEIHLSFPARYEVTLLDRLRPRPPGYTLALGFPGGGELDPQQELAQPPIFAVRPEGHPGWVGTFSGGGYGAPPAAATQIVGMPDERSICVVKHGSACVIRTDDPSSSVEIELFPVCSALAVLEHRLVVFADFTRLLAYGADGVVWRTDPVVWDDLKLVGYDGDLLRLSGFDAPANAFPEFAIDLRDGIVVGQPHK